MIVLDRITPAKAMLFKAVRLRALQDTPSAFASSYAKEAELTDEQWITRATRWNSEGAIGLIAMDEAIALRLSGLFSGPGRREPGPPYFAVDGTDPPSTGNRTAFGRGSP